MKSVRLVLLVPWLLGLALCGEAVDAGTAAGKTGEKVLMEDRIREVTIKDSGTVFLNFGAAYPDELLTAIVMKDTRPRFPGIESWAGKTVRIEGVVSDHGGHSRIILRERGQITLVAGTE